MDENKSLFSNQQLRISCCLLSNFLRGEKSYFSYSNLKKTKKYKFPNPLKEFLIEETVVTRNKFTSKGAIARSGSLEKMKLSVDFTRFLIPTMTVTIIENNKKAFNFNEGNDKTNKNHQNDFIGKGKTSYRLRQNFLILEVNLMGIFLFDRTP